MHSSQPKSKRSTMACIHCRERKVKCDNNNDGLSCERCKKTKKDCRYEPVTPATDSQPSTSPPSDPPITGDKPIMTVYQPQSPSTVPPPQVHQWPELIDPNLRTFPVDAQRPLHLPYDGMNPTPLHHQPPQAYPPPQYPVPWQQPYAQPHLNQQHFSYAHQGEPSYSAHGPGYWTGSRAPNMSNNNPGDRPGDGTGEPSGSS